MCNRLKIQLLYQDLTNYSKILNLNFRLLLILKPSASSVLLEDCTVYQVNMD